MVSRTVRILMPDVLIHCIRYIAAGLSFVRHLPYIVWAFIIHFVLVLWLSTDFGLHKYIRSNETVYAMIFEPLIFKIWVGNFVKLLL